ncbi:MAG TPA: hypothetical protein VMN57_13715 [Anaerolineales bacterium]|nr:hypothetical protein [Anaerolineales bacterium]
MTSEGGDTLTTVCSTTHLFHYMFNPDPAAERSFLEAGIRPLSDFPDSERFKQLQEHMPGFYENLYRMFAEPVLQKPYPNSGIFVTPIDFRLLPGTYLHEKPRFNIPTDRLDPAWTILTYVLDDQRVSLPYSPDTLKQTADLWDEDRVRQWFGIDNTKVFFYVPQVAAYQGVITVTQGDFEGGRP